MPREYTRANCGRTASRAAFCNERIPDGLPSELRAISPGICTREPGHEGDHHSHSNYTNLNTCSLRWNAFIVEVHPESIAETTCVTRPPFCNRQAVQEHRATTLYCTNPLLHQEEEGLPMHHAHGISCLITWFDMRDLGPQPERLHKERGPEKCLMKTAESPETKCKEPECSLEEHDGMHHKHTEKEDPQGRHCTRIWEERKKDGEKEGVELELEEVINCPIAKETETSAELGSSCCEKQLEIGDQIFVCSRDLDHEGNHHAHSFVESLEKDGCLIQWDQEMCRAIYKPMLTNESLYRTEIEALQPTEKRCQTMTWASTQILQVCHKGKNHKGDCYDHTTNRAWRELRKKEEPQENPGLVHDGITETEWFSGRAERARGTRCTARHLTFTGLSTVRCSRINGHAKNHHSHNGGTIWGRCVAAWNLSERRGEAAPEYGTPPRDQEPVRKRKKTKFETKVERLLKPITVYSEYEFPMQTKTYATQTKYQRKTRTVNNWKLQTVTKIPRNREEERNIQIQEEKYAQEKRKELGERIRKLTALGSISSHEVLSIIDMVSNVRELKRARQRRNGETPTEYNVSHKKFNNMYGGDPHMLASWTKEPTESETKSWRTAIIGARNQLRRERADLKRESNILGFEMTGRTETGEGGFYIMVSSAQSIRKILEVDKYPQTAERHVGIEIEMISKLPERALAKKLLPWADIVLLKDDGSIRPNQEAGYPYSHELNIVLPIKKIKTIAGILKAIRPDCAVNESCGLHIHIDYRNFDDAYIKRAYRGLVIAHRAMLTKVLPVDRQDNDFAEPNYVIDLDKQRSRGAGERYWQVNDDALKRHQTIEIRSHASTLNPHKILRWIHVLLLAEKTYLSKTPKTEDEFLDKIGATKGLRKYLKFRSAVLKDNPEAAEFQLIQEEFAPRIAKRGYETPASNELERELRKRVKAKIKVWKPIPTMAKSTKSLHEKECRAARLNRSPSRECNCEAMDMTLKERDIPKEYQEDYVQLEEKYGTD